MCEFKHLRTGYTLEERDQFIADIAWKYATLKQNYEEIRDRCKLVEKLNG